MSFTPPNTLGQILESMQNELQIISTGLQEHIWKNQEFNSLENLKTKN